MLHHVTAGQARFNLPGIAADVRGITLGRFIVALFPSLDRVVKLFRGLSERTNLDDLLAECRVSRVSSQTNAPELLVRLPVEGSHAADACAAAARIAGGLVFTGTSKHFVAYRDGRSPLGYDVDALLARSDDFVLYGRDFELGYKEVGVVALAPLLLSLSLQRRRDDVPGANETLLLRAERGLWRAVVGYLYRNGLESVVAACEPAAVPSEAVSSSYLVRVETPPVRVVELFRRVPGVEVYRFRGERAAVQLGYDHPLALESCTSLLEPGKLYLFSGSRNVMEIVPEAPRFVPARAVVDLDLEKSIRQRELARAPVPRSRVELRLTVSGATPRLAVGSVIQEGDAERLKRLVYLMPPTLLEQYAICQTDRDIFLYAASGLDFIPLGELYWSPVPRVMIPLGYQILPAIGGDLLLRQLEAGPDDLFFWSAATGRVCRFSASDFTPLGRIAVAEIPVTPPERVIAPQPPSDLELSLINDDVAPFPLWGFEE